MMAGTIPLVGLFETWILDGLGWYFPAKREGWGVRIYRGKRRLGCVRDVE
jgi:hypothetical protein